MLLSIMILFNYNKIISNKKYLSSKKISIYANKIYLKNNNFIFNFFKNNIKQKYIIT